MRLSDDVIFEFMKKILTRYAGIYKKIPDINMEMKLMELNGDGELLYEDDEGYLPTPYGKLWSKRRSLKAQLVSAEN